MKSYSLQFLNFRSYSIDNDCDVVLSYIKKRYLYVDPVATQVVGPLDLTSLEAKETTLFFDKVSEAYIV